MPEPVGSEGFSLPLSVKYDHLHAKLGMSALVSILITLFVLDQIGVIKIF